MTSTKELLKQQSLIFKELKSRGVIRSTNKPTGDLAEYLFCKSFDWKQASNSQKGYDAVDTEGTRYQIKARQIIKNIRSERQLSAIRNLEQKNFNFIAGLLFEEDFSIYRAALIPFEVVVKSNPHYSKHDNKHTFYLTDKIWDVPLVEDVTDKIKRTFENL